MVKDSELLAVHLFKNLSDYASYIEENGIARALGIDAFNEPEKKITKSLYFSVTPNLDHAYPPELDDLCRLHFLAKSRKVMTILEFGIGKSTVIFDFKPIIVRTY